MTRIAIILDDRRSVQDTGLQDAIASLEATLLTDATLDIKPTYCGYPVEHFSKDALIRILAQSINETRQEREYTRQSLRMFGV